MNLSRIANRIFRISRQPRRPVIHQRALEILAVRNGRKVHGHSTAVIPIPRSPMTWKQAYACAKAYARVLAGLPKWPTPKQAEELAKAEAFDRVVRRARAKGKLKMRRVRFHSVAHQKRGGATWWDSKIADVIDERERATVTAYSPRKGRRRRSDKSTQLRNRIFFEAT